MLHLVSKTSHNSILQSLVKFIRKRDPRYKKHQESQSQANNSLTPKTQSTAHIAKQKAAESYVEQDWQKVETKGLHVDLDWAAAEGEDVEEWECVACRKTFRSEAAWDSHERSKKHMKEVERLRREMEEEDEEFALDDPASVPESDGKDVTLDVSVGVRELDGVNREDEREQIPSNGGLSPVPSEPKVDASIETTPASTRREEEPARGKTKTRRKQKQELLELEDGPVDSVDDAAELADAGEAAPSKRDKRRAREAKKAETKTNAELNVRLPA